MLKTFNCGVGMLLVVSQADKNKVLSIAEGSFEIGKIINGEGVKYI
jgi:phosphoribosylaminoimidazole (AIR) synthetase